MEYSIHMTNPFTCICIVMEQTHVHLHLSIYIHFPNMVPHVDSHVVIYMYPTPFIQNNQQGHVTMM
jgi:hypothetical protein